MDKKTASKKALRRRYKRYAAALAGAAIMTGAALPGLGAATAAAHSPFTAPSPITLRDTLPQLDEQKTVKKVTASKTAKNTNKTDRTDRNGPPGRGWHEHKYSWPGSNENQGWYENGRIYYRSDNSRSGSHYDSRYDNRYSNHYDSRYDSRYNNHARYYSYAASGPVDFVKEQASKYGFDRNKDSFTLVSQSSNSATVLVKKDTTGKSYIVKIERETQRNWYVASVQSIAR